MFVTAHRIIFLAYVLPPGSSFSEQVYQTPATSTAHQEEQPRSTAHTASRTITKSFGTSSQRNSCSSWDICTIKMVILRLDRMGRWREVQIKREAQPEQQSSVLLCCKVPHMTDPPLQTTASLQLTAPSHLQQSF